MSILEIKKGQNHIAKIESQSFVDGEGVRCSVYVSGCPFQCEKCYNVKAQNFKYGASFQEEMIKEILGNCAPSYIAGLSILGGEPFCNLTITLKLAHTFRQRFGHSKTLWIWTGFLYEYLKNQTDERKELLNLTDVLVDGMFIHHLYRPNLPYKGSLNQRVINVRDSLQQNHLIEYVS
ncbi:anaerobic ribonucleoside-triphosphate reductase activating protein [Staphylococcus saccharolyticus]|uniref:Anaerobic ribonucleoside-triphosphate reductase-activating protein n=1 Tax=Staphylococcus saccharolyticus TaxID=33028 RepID=A0A380GXK1_9STAP|nr:anaerobic ribonucleoside-triphosphate reductase activating protein [Staphylococcus saccharolyticus]MBL7564653.1 anaerobic ribonucleoside-triphosphate reductase activating protein [Staphylococcus saccharolyticus]MBL7571083.1 anaerobic ribonucleoside-triphosphate reductase activating protein [Staphylococcus saccharolyticus]QQB98931.1 anaerobic ribonucleoside-triphosphate reductase activating protein [Staphylococcus saccharolyticus]QRJ66855.1 anaerobic ribonucleoside-triphosphate reductase acti